MHVRTASEEHLPSINRLVARSKSYWAWEPGYLAAALPLMAITSDYLQANLSLEICEDEAVTGFMSVVETREARLLDNLWIDPDHIGHGFGRFACDYLFDIAGRKRWLDLTTLPDPPAEGFYARMGFRDTGERVQSRVPGGPVFSIFKKEFGSPRR